MLLSDVMALGRELRTARLISGRSQLEIGRAAGITGQHVGRVERGRIRRFDARTLARIGAAVGLEVRLRAYPTGLQIRDAGQAKLLRRVRARLGPGWAWRLEAPVTGHDGRAWDATAARPGLVVRFEAESRLYDLQAQLRRIMAKWAAVQRTATEGLATDGPEAIATIDRLVLVIGSMKHNRQVLASERELLRGDFPLDTRVVIAALSRGQDPGANGILII